MGNFPTNLILLFQILSHLNNQLNFLPSTGILSGLHLVHVAISIYFKVVSGVLENQSFCYAINCLPGYENWKAVHCPKIFGPFADATYLRLRHGRS